MATFSSLPDEVHINICQNLARKALSGLYEPLHPLHNFCLTARRYYHLALPMLYEHVGRLPSTQKTVSFARTVVTNPSLASMVKSFDYVGCDELLGMEEEKANDVDERILQSLVLSDLRLHTPPSWAEVVANDNLFQTMLMELILWNLPNVETLRVCWDSTDGPEYTYFHPEGQKIIMQNLKSVMLAATTHGGQNDNDFVVMQPILAASRPLIVTIKFCMSFWGPPVPSEGYSSVLQLSLLHCAMMGHGLQSLLQMFPCLRHFEYVASADPDLYGEHALTDRRLVEAFNTDQPRQRKITRRLRSMHVALDSGITWVGIDREHEPATSLHSFISLDSLQANQCDFAERAEVRGMISKPFLHKLPKSLRSLRIDEADGTIKEELGRLASTPETLPNLTALTLKPTEDGKVVLAELQPIYRESGRTLTLLEPASPWLDSEFGSRPGPRI